MFLFFSRACLTVALIWQEGPEVGLEAGGRGDKVELQGEDGAAHPPP